MMTKIENAFDLKLAIIELERKSIKQKDIVIDQLHETYESLKPRNLIHSAVTDITGSEKITNQIFNTLPTLAFTAAASLLPQRLLTLISSKFIGKIGRTFFNIAISRTMKKYSGDLKNIGSNFLKSMVSKIIK